MFDSKFSAVELAGAGIITFFNLVTIVERGRMEKKND
jgi:hypothetical protein